MKAEAVACSIAWQVAGAGPAGEAGPGRGRPWIGCGPSGGALYRCLTCADALSELADAMLMGLARTLAGLSLAPEHRRGHGALAV